MGKGRQPWLIEVFATGVPIGALAVVFGGIAGDLPIMVAGLVTAIGAMTALLCTHGERLFSGATFAYVWNRSRGAALAAAAATAVIVLSAGPDRAQQVEIPENGRELIRLQQRELIHLRATAVATAAVREREATGVFPTITEVFPIGGTETEGWYTVSTNRQHDRQDQIVYEVAALGNSHRVFAELKGDTGVLYWNAIEPGAAEARIVTGSISEASEGSITIRDKEGHYHELDAAGEELLWAGIATNDDVVAVTDPEMTQWMSVVALNDTGTPTIREQ